MAEVQNDEDIREILEQLRAEKSRRGLSNDDIAELLRQNKTPMSDKTIGKVFRYGSTDTSVRRHTLQTIAVALGLDLVNQKANLILVQERRQLEKELEASRSTVEHMSKTLDAMSEQITSMRAVIRATESHTAEREAQIKQLNDQMGNQLRRLRRKDMFLHLFTVGTLTASLTAFFMSATGFMHFGWRKK